MPRYLFPEGIRVKSVCEGCMGSSQVHTATLSLKGRNIVTSTRSSNVSGCNSGGRLEGWWFDPWPPQSAW